MANVAVPQSWRSRAPGDRVPVAPRNLWLLGLAFLVVLALGVVAAVSEVALRVRRDLIAAHLTAPALNDDRFVTDVLLRQKNRPGYAYVSQGQHYTNNALGLRGPDIPRDKPAGVRRVVLVGGSTVYGAVVDDQETISVQLESLLHAQFGSGVQVVNGGVPGYTALQELLLARSDLMQLQPDVVIDLDGLNDVFYGSLAEWPSQVAADQLGVIADGRFPEVAAMIDATMFPSGLLEHQVTMLGRTLNRTVNVALFHHTAVEPRSANERVVALHAESLGLMARAGRESGIPMIAALQPLLAAGHKQLSANEIAAVEREGYWSGDGWEAIALTMYPRLAVTTRAAVEAEGGAFVDMTSVFDSETETAYAEDAVHYTPLGNRRLAEALARLIVQRLR